MFCLVTPAAYWGTRCRARFGQEKWSQPPAVSTVLQVYAYPLNCFFLAHAHALPNHNDYVCSPAQSIGGAWGWSGVCEGHKKQAHCLGHGCVLHPGPSESQCVHVMCVAHHPMTHEILACTCIRPSATQSILCTVHKLLYIAYKNVSCCPAAAGVSGHSHPVCLVWWARPHSPRGN